MLKLKKRIINIRVMFAVFCGLMVGIFFSTFLVKNLISFNSLLIIALAIVLFSISAFVYAECTKKYNSTIECRKNVSGLIQYASIGFVLFFVIGVFISIQPVLSMFYITDYSNVSIKVTGMVSDYVQQESTHKKFIIDNCVIVFDDKSQVLDYKICAYSTSFFNVELGDTITFVSELDRNDFYRDSDFSQLIQDIAYTTFIDNSTVEIVGGDKELKDIVKQNTKDILDSNLNADNASISYAILFGEKQGLSDNIKDMFSYAGISHILAVSGLHIGVLVTLLYFVLKIVFIFSL